jgi:transposase-like protein
MEPEKCPTCGSTSVLFLSGPSRIAHVDYHRCEDCRQVWTVTRDEARVVTLVKFHRLP